VKRRSNRQKAAILGRVAALPWVSGHPALERHGARGVRGAQETGTPLPAVIVRRLPPAGGRHAARTGGRS